MKFSVLMPAYNAEPYIAEAIDSILAQSHGGFELLIMDDGSTDGTASMIAGYTDPRIRVMRQDNAGKSVAMNAMIAEATGDYIVMQDADDVSAPHRLEVLAAHFRRHPDHGGALSGYALIIDGKVLAPRIEAKDAEQARAEIMAFRLPSHDPTLCCRTDFARAHPFNTELRIMQGVDFVFRLGESLPLSVIGEALYHYRIHPSSITKTDPGRRLGFMRKTFDQVRARRGLEPLDDAAFEAAHGAQARDPSNNLIGHFTDSAYLQMMAGDRRGALHTAAAAFRYARSGARTLKPLIYALSPKLVARAIRSRGAASSQAA